MLIALQPNVAGQRMGRVVLALAASAGCLFSQHTTSRVASDARSTPTAGAPMHIFGPGILATGGHGEAYVAVPDGVFRIDPTGVRTRIAGLEREWRYSAGGLNPRGVALDAAGNLYLADAGNNRIRKLTIASGAITTVAGNGVKGFSGDGGPATSAELEGPTGVAVDRDGNLYIADGMVDGHDRIRMIAAATGVIATVAGNGSQGYSGDDGPATLAQLSSLGGLAVDTAGNLYIADNFNNRIRRVSLANGIITTVAGSGVEGFSGDGGLAVSARLDHPLSVAVDAAGDLFIADSGNYRVRKLTTATGIIFTTANGRTAYPDAQHGFPCSLAVDAEGNLYIADSGISRIRKVSSASAAQPVVEAEPALVQSQGSAGFKINVTYDTSVPAAAQSAFNSLISTY
jgi:trimeric autotransporter adhesin